MKRLLLSLFAVLLLASPADAKGQTGHYIRKLLWLPIYVVFSTPVALITWWEVADENKKLEPVSSENYLLYEGTND